MIKTLYSIIIHWIETLYSMIIDLIETLYSMLFTHYCLYVLIKSNIYYNRL